jgi:type IV secretion system protein VirB10
VFRLIAFLISAGLAGVAGQNPAPASAPSDPASAAPQAAAPSSQSEPAVQTAAPVTSQPAQTTVRQITVPVDTEILLQLKNVIDTKSAHAGDGVYCQTTFPVVIDNVIVIPAGTYVKGEITKVQRAGRISGRAGILFHFNSVIFPSGYTVDMPGTLHGDPGTTKAKIADDEGTVKTDGHDKVKQLPEVGRDAAYGSVGGAIATGTVNGARIGGGIGAAAGLATMLLTRGSDVRIEPGAALTMRLQRPLVVDVTSTVTQAQTQVVPRDTSNRLRVPPPASKPQ